jgi:endoglucanase
MLIRRQVLPRSRVLPPVLLGFALGLTVPPALPAQAFLSISPRATNQGQVELRWPSKVGERYTIWASTNLVNEFEMLSSGLQATQPENVWWADRSAANFKFFRLSTDGAGPQPANVVTNGDFSNGLTKWTPVINSAVDANIAVVSGEAVTTIGTNAGTPVQLQLIQTGISLTNGRTYTLRFDARSLPLGRPIDARITSTNSAPRTNYLQQDSIVITPSMTTYTVVFVMTNTTDPAARVVFNFGGDTNDVTLDNVVFHEGKSFQNRGESYELARRMGAGNNFMAAWAVGGKAAPEDAALLNRSHFNHCRIGYKMDELCGAGPNYVIPTNEMRQLQDIVDNCLDEGLIAVVDPIHNWANGPGYATNDLPKLVKIWQQVAARFANYPLDMVVFEIMNEPHSGSNISNIIANALPAIRAFPGNQQRQVIVSGEGFSTRQALINAFNNDWIPANDANLIGTFHYYDPRVFTVQGDPAGPLTNVFWGATTEVAQVDMDFDAVSAANNDWAARHAVEPLPIYLGEFGVDNFAPAADRKRWLARIRMAAEQRGFAHAHWAMYNNEPDAKGMGPWTTAVINNPSLRTFDAAPLEALMTHYEAESQAFSAGVTSSAVEPGFIGTGYAKFPVATGTNVYCEINGYIPTDDAYAVEIRYAATTARTLTLKSLSNAGTTVQSRGLLFPATGGSNCWAIARVTVNFQAGENARLRIIADPDAGPSIDYVRFTR